MNYKRIFLKLSWEALWWNWWEWINHGTVKKIAHDIQSLLNKGHQIWLMVWAGNIFRGRNEWQWLDPAIGHYAWMLWTMVNALVLQNIMYQAWIDTAVFSSIEMPRFIKTMNKISAVNRLAKNTVVICAWGSWNPFCSTDLWSVTRALELDCDVVVKCTNVDGVYDKNPHQHDDAVKFPQLTYKEALNKELKIMDFSAFWMAMENNLTTYVTHIDSLWKLDFSAERWTIITP